MLIHKSVQFQLKNLNKDRLGQYLIMQGTLLTEDLNLMNVYGPNIDYTHFNVDLFLALSVWRILYNKQILIAR